MSVCGNGRAQTSTFVIGTKPSTPFHFCCFFDALRHSPPTVNFPMNACPYVRMWTMSPECTLHRLPSDSLIE